MGLLSWLFGTDKRNSINNPNVPATANNILISGGNNINTPFGIVTPRVALSVSTVFACCRVIAETLATLGLHLYQTTDKGKRKATEHPLYNLVNTRPHINISSAVWLELLSNRRLLHGNSFDAIQRNGAGLAVQLIPLDNSNVNVKIVDGVKVFDIDGTMYNDLDVLHVPNFSMNGLQGESTIQFARTSISLALAAEEYGARYFSQGTSGDKYFEVPDSTPQLERQRLSETWAAKYSGITNAHRIPQLPSSIKLHQLSAPNNDDIQFLETRQFSVPEICRWFRCPPHKVQDLSKSTNGNLEQQELEFVQDTIKPLATLIEQELNYKLLLPQERGEYFFQFNLDSLLRADKYTRYQCYAIGRQWGWLSSNDVLVEENANRLPGEDGNIYLDPLNMVPASTFAKTGKPEPTSIDDSDGSFDDRSVAITAITPIFEDVINRMNRKAKEAMTRAARSPGSFEETKEAFYNKHFEMLAASLKPVIATYLLSRNKDKSHVDTVATTVAATVVKEQKKRLLITNIEEVIATDINTLLPQLD